MPKTAQYIVYDTEDATDEPATIIRECVKRANATGLIVRANVMEVVVWAFPDDDPDQLIRSWARQQSRPWVMNRTAIVFQTFR